MISIVQYSRYDNHGENLLKRMLLSFYAILEAFETVGIELELIIVDYNPTTKYLYQILRPNKKLKYSIVRHIVVDSLIHKKFKDYYKLPINNMLARNIGIRRAKGDFILSTGIDVIFSLELVEKLKKLEKHKLYRVNRLDVNNYILNLDFNNLSDILKFCKRNVIDIHFNTNKNENYIDPNIPTLHTNNCGDFQLTAKENWHYLRGYPEIDLMCIHCDSIFSYMCYFYGLEEEVINANFYHIDHESRWLKPIYTHILRNWRMLYFMIGEKVYEYKSEYYKLAKKISNDFNERSFLDEIDYEYLTTNEFKFMVRKLKNNFILNNEDWGCGNCDFKEIIYDGNS